jgi:hypothetical protein
MEGNVIHQLFSKGEIYPKVAKIAIQKELW